MVLGIGTSVILARFLGPEGKGLYSLAVLLPTLIVTFMSLGIGPATVYHVARKDFSPRVAFGNNLLFALVIGAVGVIAGVVLTVFFADKVFPGIPQNYLLFTLCLIPLKLLNAFFLYVHQGQQQFESHSLLVVLPSLFYLVFVVIGLILLRRGVFAAIIAVVASYLIVDLVHLRLVRGIPGGMCFTPDCAYIKAVLKYGWKAYLLTVVTFLNYRLDMLLVNGYLGAAAVGFYSVGVGLVEKLWLVPSALSMALFPRLSAERDEERGRELASFLARSTLWLTGIAASVLVLLCQPIIVLLYSEAYVPAVQAAQILLVGIVALAGARPLINYLAGRGRPMLNTYAGIVALVMNLGLNIGLIPKLGITGAAWASTVSYTVSYAFSIVAYCRISGSEWRDVVLLKRSDFTRYRALIVRVIQRR